MDDPLQGPWQPDECGRPRHRKFHKAGPDRAADLLSCSAQRVCARGVYVLDIRSAPRAKGRDVAHGGGPKPTGRQGRGGWGNRTVFARARTPLVRRAKVTTLAPYRVINGREASSATHAAGLHRGRPGVPSSKHGLRARELLGALTTYGARPHAHPRGVGVFFLFKARSAEAILEAADAQRDACPRPSPRSSPSALVPSASVSRSPSPSPSPSLSTMRSCAASRRHQPESPKAGRRASWALRRFPS